MIFILILQFIITTAEENCESIACSNVFDHVCGMARTWDGTTVISKYQNICHMRKIQCHLKPILEFTQVSEKLCRRKKYPKDSLRSGRRLTDFSVVGAHQACNHTCPTYCVDTYEPACAQIWKRGMKKFDYRPMINHCHIDLFSCAVGVNVTIQPLGKCYNNPSGLLFMSQVAAMKSLRLLDDAPLEINHQRKMGNSRRSNNIEWQVDDLLRRLLK